MFYFGNNIHHHHRVISCTDVAELKDLDQTSGNGEQNENLNSRAFEDDFIELCRRWKQVRKDQEILNSCVEQIQAGSDIKETGASGLSQLDRISERQNEDIVYLAIRQRSQREAQRERSVEYRLFSMFKVKQIELG